MRREGGVGEKRRCGEGERGGLREGIGGLAGTWDAQGAGRAMRGEKGREGWAVGESAGGREGGE